MASRQRVLGSAATTVASSVSRFGDGTGRLAFTPVFPLMQERLGVTLVEGAWLAAANYAGYLVGACLSFGAVALLLTQPSRGIANE